MTDRILPTAHRVLRLALGLAGSALFLLAASISAQPQAQAPAWRVQASPVNVELRGLAVVSDRVAWASGSKGTILRTIDGEAWNVIEVAGAEALDFRDIEAWDENNAIALSIGSGASSNVYKTTDGGKTWRRVFANTEPTGFWDALAFWDRDHGALFGDPVRGRFDVFTTSDAGESWVRVPDAGMPAALENEGAFAASGSCLAVGPGRSLAFVTGGARESRVFISVNGGRSFSVTTSPVPAGAASKGLFSIAWLDEKTLLTVGGDYKEPTLDGIKASLSPDGGGRWMSVASNPGFLSSVVRGPEPGSVVAVGLAGTGLSADGGRTWTAIDAAPYNTVGFAPSGDSKANAAGWAVGPKGVIARWSR